MTEIMLNLRPSLRYRLLTACAALLSVTVVHAQSFNIDLDLEVGPPEVGTGVPSAGFGAAASQPGAWNGINVTSGLPVSLVDVQGAATSVVYQAIGAGSGGGSGSTINTGDYRLLLNDYADVVGQLTFNFSGIANGQYRIYTYAVRAAPNEPWPVSITVPGSVQGTEIVNGPMPGNAFGHIVTHSIHDVSISSGAFQIIAVSGQNRGRINGFQIVSVPEPLSVGALGAAIFLSLRKRTSVRREMRRTSAWDRQNAVRPSVRGRALGETFLPYF